MEVPTFTQTQLDVAEIKRSNDEILARFLQREVPVLEDKDPKDIDEVVRITGYKKRRFTYIVKIRQYHIIRKMVGFSFLKQE